MKLPTHTEIETPAPLQVPILNSSSPKMEHLNPTSSSLCILLLLLVMHSCSSISARSLGNETDRLALLDMKLQMSDPNGFLNSWNGSQHHCQWPGVSCNIQHHRVTALSLRGKSLYGTISPHIGNLSFMKVIQLGGNSLHGGIPRQIGQLSRLRVFNLSFNLLFGEIPVNLTRCSKLTTIDLSSNQLIGKIPTELGSLTKLEEISIGSSNLTGMIPASLGNLSLSLRRISLPDNKLEGYIPNELGSLSSLVLLQLSDNKLSGQIPSSVFNICTLETLRATLNFFSGKLPIDLGLNLPVLKALALHTNQLYGEIPVSITNCTNLEVLDLGNNGFEGIVSPSVGQLLNLQKFILQYNSFRGRIEDVLVSLTNCTNLKAIALSYNEFSGELSNTIGNLSSQLTYFFLAHNKMSGTIPREFGKLAKLEIISIGDNSLAGVLPADLAKLQNLEILNVYNNSLSGHIPLKLCNNMTYLYDLELFNNNFGGDVSHILANCLNLQVLFIDGNKFSGTIPSQVFRSHISLTYLDLGYNSFTGTVPVEIGKLANLQNFDISGNGLYGDIPSTIRDCSVLALFAMSDNLFSGPLPPILTSLKGIEYLDLSNNTFTGPILHGLSRLVYLKHLDLSYNDLEGEVPTIGVFSNASQIMLEGNTKLCGGIYELGLPPCSVVTRKRKWTKHLKIILIPLLSALAISITLFLYLFHRKKNDRVRAIMPPLPTEKKLRVSYHDLYLATSEFSPANLIGSGSFGFVYKGGLFLDHGEIKVVAVKVLDLQKRGASKSFKAECRALSNLRHRNLVPLLTYCSSIDHKGDEFKALIYKYMENGSLDTWLHPDSSQEPTRISLNLVQRINIAIDVASALDHLHNHSHVAVAHCDVKPSNILLDNDLTAFVGDFGLARLLLPQLEQGASSSTVAIKGTIGYAAPEYAMGLEISIQGDVYSYGILLLEMFTGRRPTDDAFTEGLDLHSYVKMGLSDQVWEIVDPSLLSGEAQVETRLKEQECIISALKLGIGCSQAAAKDRMDMKQVTRELHFIRDAFCAV